MHSVSSRKWNIGIRFLAALSVAVMVMAFPAGILPAKADSLSDSQKNWPNCKNVRKSWKVRSKRPEAVWRTRKKRWPCWTNR